MNTFSVNTIAVLLAVCISAVNSSQYVTLWSPKEMIARLPYEIHLVSSQMSQETEISVRFDQRNVTATIESNKQQHITFPNQRDVVADTVDVTMTLLRNDSLAKNSVCYTQKLAVPIAKKRFLTFVQLDKPIYKPGDTINARIVVVNRNLVPQDMRVLTVELFAPNSLYIRGYTFNTTDLFAVQEVQFNLTEYAIIGNWKLRAIVDDYGQFATTKVIPVQKYLLPLFDVIFTSSHEYIFYEDSFVLSFYAQYPFDELVMGNAEITLKILNVDDEVKYSFKNVKELQSLTIDIQKDLESLIPYVFEILLCKATITFQEPESQVSISKSLLITISGEDNYKLRVTHKERFIYGFPFYVHLVLLDKRGQVVTYHGDQPQFKYFITKKDSSKENGRQFEDIQEITTFIIMPKDDWDFFELEIRFATSSIYRSVVKSGGVDVALEGLKVDFYPMLPVIGEDITVIVGSGIEMDAVYTNVANIQGTWDWEKIECNNKLTCSFTMTMHEKYFPKSTLNVYHIQDEQHIFTGRANITSSSFGSNELKMSMSTGLAATKEDVTFDFEAMPESTIYLLAIDKRLTYLLNETTLEDDIRFGMNEYDGNSHINIFFADDDASWHVCTEGELEQVDSGRQYYGQHSDGIIYPVYGDNETFTDKIVGKRIKEPEITDTVEDFLRDFFPETWIFDKLSINEQMATVSRTYKTPDSITTWIVSAFSTVEDHRLAFARSQELVVKNNFFMKINLPYSIRYREVLRLDVLLYNYVSNREDLYVEVQLHNRIRITDDNQILTEFEFIEYGENEDFCRPVVANYTTATDHVTIPYMSTMRVSFYIRSNEFDNTNSSYNLQNLEINVFAHAEGVRTKKKYKDRVIKSIKVEPVGTSSYSVIIQDLILDKQSMNHTEFVEKSGKIDAGDSRNFPGAEVIISGEYMTIFSGISENFRFTKNHCLLQRTTLLKGCIEFYRYELANHRTKVPDLLNEYLQTLQDVDDVEGHGGSWYHSNTTGFKAYFAEALITCNETGVLPYHEKYEELIRKQLDFIMDFQLESGAIKAPFFPADHPPNSTENSITVFDTCFLLIPFLKFQKQNDEDSRYSAVIKKAMKYIRSELKTGMLDKFAYSIGAYIYALIGQDTQAQNIIDKLEEDSFVDDDGRKCYMAYKNFTECDPRHTTYVALTLITLNKKTAALPIVRWLVLYFNTIKMSEAATYMYGLMSEPISKLATMLSTRGTDLQLSIYNEFGYMKNYTINMNNRHETIFENMPSFSRRIGFILDGEGYISISTRFEMKAIFNQSTDALSVTASPEKNGNDWSINVCIKYNRTEHLRIAINEIELPSGYMKTHMDEHGLLRRVEELNDGSLLVLYYNALENFGVYCSRVYLRKLFEVKNMQLSSVKVYDFVKNNEIAVNYYQINQECSGK